MTRKKVNLAYIANASARKVTLKKRKKGLMKKVSELCTLCDVDACAIISGPHDFQPDVWPSDSGVKRVIERFKTMPELQQHTKMVNQESFTQQRINKAEELLKKQLKENHHKEMTHVMYQCLNGGGFQYLSMVDLMDLDCLLKQNLKDIERRIELAKKGRPDMTTMNEIGRGQNGLNDQMNGFRNNHDDECGKSFVERKFIKA
ncbi:Agamous-like MADS-box protein [Actinidia chinensis var. chinensis]|uniref:Agamous-like MADS-box protein n=1 Tax=Actinidia chinensis var. chinensis TaxID=1590841 RepID=A0A2R6QKZ3_ACTCC|nr:Agamous-like MADS-box protein [Actinidia chinensis var. chinensis]